MISIIMISIFIDRTKELDFLNERYKLRGPDFFVIYGRRRVGKTELMKHFIKNKPHIYYLADRIPENEQLKILTGMTVKFYNDQSLVSRPPKDWYSLFEYISENTGKERLVLVIDELPHLFSTNKAMSSIFQKIWDEHLKHTNIFLIVCGSSISMMEKDVLSYKSPLYGRRTGQWKLEALNFSEIKHFFPKHSTEEQIEIFSILGGVPQYLVEFDELLPVFENIEKFILTKGKFMYEEVEFLLREELREPAIYFLILKSIALGNAKFGHILNYTGLEKTKLTIYLQTLEKLNIIKRILPVTEKNSKSKKSFYIISDNFVKFWFSFVFPNRVYIEQGKKDFVLSKKIKPVFSKFVSFCFEDICRAFVQETEEYDKTGMWWGFHRENEIRKEIEIDIVAINEQAKDILFVECKWQSKVNAEKILAELKEKAKHVEWNNEKRKEHYAVFAKSFSKRIKECKCYDLKDMEKVLRKR